MVQPSTLLPLSGRRYNTVHLRAAPKASRVPVCADSACSRGAAAPKEGKQRPEAWPLQRRLPLLRFTVRRQRAGMDC